MTKKVKGYSMALRIKDNKVINVVPPKLTRKQVAKMERAAANTKIIQRATARKYNIVYS